MLATTLHIAAAILALICTMAPLAFGMALAIAFVEDRRRQRVLRRPEDRLGYVRAIDPPRPFPGPPPCQRKGGE
jgi:hypothetical protein